MKRICIFLLLLTFFIFTSPKVFGQTPVPPQEERFEGVITEISNQKTITILEKKQLYQKIKVKILEGSRKGNEVFIEHGSIPTSNTTTYKRGDTVVVNVAKTPDGKEFLYITDYVRRTSLYWLAGIFIGLTILIGRVRGVTSLFGLILSFLIIFYFLLPQILSGQDPVAVTIMASFFIIPITFFLSHGINKKTIAAVLGTAISLVATGALASIFVNLASLTGFASEEATFLQVAKEGAINLRGLILAGMIVGVLGILDDVTISQSAIVYQLKQTSPHISFKELYMRAMDIGRDHIASMVNTLILVYTGAAMPLLLLFTNNTRPFAEIINFEIVAEEIIRTLIGSIGLILAVPITTLIACLLITKD